MFPKHGELRGSERWDKPSGAWVRADEWQQRQWAREDAAFARMANQGELKAPMIIGDSMKALRSQASGKIYDSKSSLRREYRDLGMIEVGNDVPKTKWVNGKRPETPNKRRDIEAALYRAKSELDIPTNITKVVHDEAGMRRLAAEKKIF
jgi:hypothetical protein